MRAHVCTQAHTCALGLTPTPDTGRTRAQPSLAHPPRAPRPRPTTTSTHPVPPPAGKVVYAETTTAHATLTGLHYYHQDWFHAAAYVTVPPLRLDTNTSAYLMSLLAKYGSPGCSPRPLPVCHALWAPCCQGAALPGATTTAPPHPLGTPLLGRAPGNLASWARCSLCASLP